MLHLIRTCRIARIVEMMVPRGGFGRQRHALTFAVFFYAFADDAAMEALARLDSHPLQCLRSLLQDEGSSPPHFA